MRRRKNNSGVVLVWVILLMLIFVGIVGLSIDTGYTYLAGAKIQTAADAAALAGALYVKTDANQARSKAAQFGLLNTAAQKSVGLGLNSSNGPAGDIVIGRFSTAKSAFTPTLTSPNAVQVTARFTSSSSNGPVGLLFGPIFGVDTANITRKAIAVAVNVAGGDAGIIVLNPTASPALTMAGSGEITVVGGDVQVNSNGSAAVKVTGYGSVTADEVDVVGKVQFTGYGTIVGDLETGAPAIPDPLANLPAPAKGPDLGAVNLTGSQSKTLSPGYYSGGITASGNGNLTLSPGIYVLDGAGLNYTGNGALTALGVTVYVTGTGKLNITGQGAVHITPPDPSVNTFAGADTYQGISLIQDRASRIASKITGWGNLNLDGVIYLPGSWLTLYGNGDVFGAQVIVDTLTLAGNGSVRVARSGGHVHPVPVKVYLVQ